VKDANGQKLSHIYFEEEAAELLLNAINQALEQRLISALSFL
jgi:hypothetical protein